MADVNDPYYLNFYLRIMKSVFENSARLNSHPEANIEKKKSSELTLASSTLADRFVP